MRKKITANAALMQIKNVFYVSYNQCKPEETYMINK